MALLKLPVKSPSLVLVLSLLEQDSASSETEAFIDWLLVHIASDNLSRQLDNSPELSTVGSLFSVVNRLFIKDITLVCRPAGDSSNNKALAKYLTEGRGLIFLSALQKTVSSCTTFQQELAAVLLSLATILQSDHAEDEDTPRCPLLSPVSPPSYPGSEGLTVSAVKKRSSCYRQSKVRRRAPLSVFPDVFSAGPRKEVGENLTQWEGSPSSDEHHTDHPSPSGPQDSQIKYIPINYFEYFDNANLNSDEFSEITANLLPRPPPLPPVSAGLSQVVDTVLQLTSVLAFSTDNMAPHNQPHLIQLAVVACNLYEAASRELTKCQCLCVISACLFSVRYRPDLLLSAPIQGVLTRLTLVFTCEQISVWGRPAVCCLQVWRDLALANTELPATIKNLKDILSSIILGLATGPASLLWCQTLLSLISVLQDLPDQEFVLESVNKVLGLTAEIGANTEISGKVLESVTRLFGSICYPADKLSSLTTRLETFSNTDNYSAFLIMLEQVLDNLAESETRWAANMMEVRELDKDSAVESSEMEDNENIQQQQLSSRAEFHPYLVILRSADPGAVELTLSHLQRLVARADGDTRHRIALQVILPFLSFRLETAAGEVTEAELEQVLLILSQLVTQQPTAMALIRNHQTWKLIKHSASKDSFLSSSCQEVIKSIVLNSNKFIKIRLSEAEAMALQDDENDIINFDQRDRNAQYWLFKQFYHVLVQSSINIINRELIPSYHHVSQAWSLTLSLVRRLPEFLVYSVERGVISLAQQLLESLKDLGSKQEVADTTGRIVQLVMFLLTTKHSWQSKVPNLDITDVESFYEAEISARLKGFLEVTPSLKVNRTVLSLVLVGSCSEKNVADFEMKKSPDSHSDVGYDADHSDMEEVETETDQTCQSTLTISFKPGFKSFIQGVQQIIETSEHGLADKLYSLEYLLFKLEQVEMSTKALVTVVNDALLCPLLDLLFTLTASSPADPLSGLCSLTMKLVGKLSQTFLSPRTIKKIFRLLSHQNCLQSVMLKSFTSVLTARLADYNLPSISIVTSKARDRMSSSLSSDSGLDSSISICSNHLSLSSSRKFFIKEPVDDLEREYTIILRIKIDVVSSRSKDDWLELVKIENRSETLGIQVNLVKGLKMTLSNWKETYAAAETNFQTMFQPGRWTHLVFNIGTVTEGNRSTKTLSAFIDCCRRWDVGLSVDRVNTRQKKEKFLCLTVGQTTSHNQNSLSSSVDIKTSDVYFLGNCNFSLQDIVQDFLTDSRYLPNRPEGNTRVNLKRLGEKLPDLLCYCLPLVNRNILTPSASCTARLVAHFTPSGLWNSRTFLNQLPAWTLQRGLFSVGNLEGILLLPAAAIEHNLDVEIVTDAFNAAINFVISDQETFQTFLRMGGVSLFTKLLKILDKSHTSRVVETFLTNSGYTPPSSGFHADSKIILFPELLDVLFDVPAVAEVAIPRIIEVITQYIDEDNIYSNFNLNFVQSSQLLENLKICLVNLSKEGKAVPILELSNLLIFVPPSARLVQGLMESCLLLCPPHLLYLSGCSSGRAQSQRITTSDEDYFQKIHSKEVVDVTSILDASQSEQPVVGAREEPSSLEYLEQEESAVEGWEVLTGDVPPPDLEAAPPSPRPHSALCSTPLLATLLSTAVSKLRLLSDKEVMGTVRPVLLLPLISHTASEVHTAALDMLTILLGDLDCQEETFDLIAALVSSHSSSPRWVESVLSLLHGHHVNIDLSYEYLVTSPPSLHLVGVRVLLPVLLASHSQVYLSHNLITHIHELAANIPPLLSALLDCGIYQTLLTMLARLAENPGQSSDICGYFESDLLVEDINNFLRLILVKLISGSQADYDIVLDMLFVAAGMISSETVKDSTYLRASLSLCLEECLYSLQGSISQYRVYTPSHYLNIENWTTEMDLNPKSKLSQKESSILVDRFKKIVKFAVNCLSCVEQLDVDEEIGLVSGLFNMVMDLESAMTRKKENDMLIKSLVDDTNIGGVLLVMLIRSPINLSNKIELIRKVDALANTRSVVKKFFVSPEERETFRLCVITLVGQSLLMDNVDCELVTKFYGELLSVDMFPGGPGVAEPLIQLRHKTFAPWEAERDRCRQTAASRQSNRAETVARTAERLSEHIIVSHDTLVKDSLERTRMTLCASYDSGAAWKTIVKNQIHPLGLWHNVHHQPASLVLDNISGTSGIYTRFRWDHCGLTREKYFKEGHKHLGQPTERSFSKLLSAGDGDEMSLADRLGGVEKVQSVEMVEQVTATSCDSGELVISCSKIFFVGSSNWNCSYSNIEAACRRRYQLKDIAIEFFLNSGETHLIVFQSPTERNSVLAFLDKAGVSGKIKSANLPVTTKLWRQGHLTNFQYLMELNRLSGRTFNDLMQHPVFPWILADYSSPHLNLTLHSSFRNLRRPIAVQKDGSEDKYVSNYNILASDCSALGALMGPYHYASHYSNTGIVLHYLVRVPPFTAEFVKFQDGNFDLPDRSFHKLETSWMMASEISASDVKELIPQLFYLPEMFNNTENFNFGVRQNGASVDNVELPAWAPDARAFVKIHRQALESSYVRQELAHWIDLVFGYKQTGSQAVEAVNVFHPATYSGNQSQALDEVEARARQTMIETYGQTPVQLFSSPHPLPLAELVSPGLERSSPAGQLVTTVTGLQYGSYVGAPGQPSPTVVWQQSQGVGVASLVRLETNEMIGLPPRHLLLGRYSSGRSLGQIYSGLQLVGTQLLTWGHSDNSLHVRPTGDTESRPCADLSWDAVTTGQSHPRLGAVWAGHQSGMVSVYQVGVASHGARLTSLSGPPRYLHGHCDQVTSIRLCPEFGIALTGAEDGSVITWDLHSLHLLHHTILPCHTTAGLSADISSKSGDIAVAADSSLYLFTINLKPVSQCTLSERITAITFSNQEEGTSINCVAVGLNTGMVKLFSSLDLSLLRDLALTPPSPVTALTYSEDSQNLSIATQDGMLTILEKSGEDGMNKTPKYVTLQ